MSFRHIVGGVALGTSCAIAGGVLALTLHKQLAPKALVTSTHIQPGYMQPTYRPEPPRIDCSKEGLRQAVRAIRDCRRTNR